MSRGSAEEAASTHDRQSNDILSRRLTMRYCSRAFDGTFGAFEETSVEECHHGKRTIWNKKRKKNLEKRTEEASCITSIVQCARSENSAGRIRKKYQVPWHCFLPLIIPIARMDQVSSYIDW